MSDLNDDDFLKGDFHIHTQYSGDAKGEIEEVLQKSRENKLDFIAITDHNQVKGAFEAKKLGSKFDVNVIVGEEIKTSSDTDIIGLFLDKRIQPGLPEDKVIKEVHDQGGLVIAPHPFSFYRGGIGDRISDYDIDYVEIYNGLSMFWENRRAYKFSEKLNIPGIAGSDAHRPREIGIAYSIFREKRDIKNLTPIDSNICLSRSFVNLGRRFIDRIRE